MLSRHAFEEVAAIVGEGSRVHDLSYGAMMIDIDYFRKFNDVTGCQEGDACLGKVAGCIRKTCRAIDVLGRYGGDEFTVLVPEFDLAATIDVAERIVEAVRTLAITHPGRDDGSIVTVSVGVAGGLGDWRSVVGLASAALCEAKENGRDRVAAMGKDA